MKPASAFGNDVKCELEAGGTGIPHSGTSFADLFGFGQVDCKDSNGDPADVESIFVTAQFGRQGKVESKSCRNQPTCIAPIETIVADRNPARETLYNVFATGSATAPVNPTETGGVIRVPAD
ncbi:MAG TPA: hypothetical protein VH247_15635 [Thermoleophilaceae bacterium]|nr:hypothetical protein [Thermoleophilaceae bacterium]